MQQGTHSSPSIKSQSASLSTRTQFDGSSETDASATSSSVEPSASRRPTSRRSSTAAGSPWKKRVTRNGKVYTYWAIQTVQNGKRRTLTARTRDEVVAKRDGVAEPVVLRSQSQSLGVFLEQWVARVRTRVAHGTWRQWESHIRVHLVPRLGHIHLRDLTVGDVEDYLDRDDLSPRTLSHHRSTLRVALNKAKRKGLVLTNVAQDAEAPKQKVKEATLLTPSQVKLLIDGTVGEPLGALWAVIGTTGLRIAEALGLTWADLDLDDRMLHVRHTLHRVDGEWQLHEPKTLKSSRSIPLSQGTVNSLRAHRLRQIEERLAQGHPGTDGLVFTTPSGRPIHPSNATALLHRETDRIGLPRVTVHSIRHSVATELIGKGVPIAMVAAWLGHSSSRVTETVYSHVGGKDLVVGAEVMERMVR